MTDPSTTASTASLNALIEAVALRHDRAIREEVVDYAMGRTPLEGFLAEPAGSFGPRKAVLVLHAWGGVGPVVAMRSRMIARLGYAAFAPDLYGAGVRPTTPSAMAAEAATYYADLPLLRARVAAGFDVLVARGFAPADIVVIGYCFGGTAALEFAREAIPCAGIVSFHGRLLTHDSGDPNRYAAPVLVLTGAEDDLVPDSAVTAFADELRVQPDLDWTITVYAGAPHAFTVPGERFRPLADARSWRAFVDFLDEVAPDPLAAEAGTP
jgi:dienelactone hydrolase